MVRLGRAAVGSIKMLSRQDRGLPLFPVPRCFSSFRLARDQFAGSTEYLARWILVGHEEGEKVRLDS